MMFKGVTIQKPDHDAVRLAAQYAATLQVAAFTVETWLDQPQLTAVILPDSSN